MRRMASLASGEAERACAILQAALIMLCPSSLMVSGERGSMHDCMRHSAGEMRQHACVCPQAAPIMLSPSSLMVKQHERRPSLALFRSTSLPEATCHEHPSAALLPTLLPPCLRMRHEHCKAVLLPTASVTDIRWRRSGGRSDRSVVVGAFRSAAAASIPSASDIPGAVTEDVCPVIGFSRGWRDAVFSEIGITHAHAVVLTPTLVRPPHLRFGGVGFGLYLVCMPSLIGYGRYPVNLWHGMAPD